METTKQKSELFTPYQLGPITLRNRIIRSSAFENMCKDNRPTQMLQDYHVSVARGGVGMTTVAYCSVDKSGVSFNGQLYVHDEIIPDLKKLTDAIHAEGAKVSIQLGHCGDMTHYYTCGCMPVSSSTHFNLYSPTIARGLKKSEIKTIVKHFGEAVDFCRKAGFDCVEIHAGHGYLIDQFISPDLNHRHDEYGGSFENRVRFMNEVLDEVMLHAGNDMAVVVKTNMFDGYKKGVQIDEGIRVAQEIAKHKVHGIILSAGFVSKAAMFTLGGAMPLKSLAYYMTPRQWMFKIGLKMCGKLMIPPAPFKELFFMDAARKFVKAVDVPCIYVGGIQSRDNCETVLKEGFPLMQMAHVLIKDPEFVNHMMEDEHYHAGCGRSNYCVGRMYTLEMKCHDCVLREHPEQLPAKLQKEIDRLEADRKADVERQYKKQKKG